MQKSDYRSFFFLPTISFPHETFFGASHFFNRTKVSVGAVNYDEILHNKKRGRLFLGQLPVAAFNADLLKELSSDGLIVSCNEAYELAGYASVIKITDPSSWQQVGIDHHHLPFKDFTDQAEPALILETLAKMLDAYKRGGAIYVHCKAGRSRSPLIVALFMSIIDRSSSDAWQGYNEKELKQWLNSKIAQLKEQRPQTDVDKDKVKLGVSVLQQYIKNLKNSPLVQQEEVYTQSAAFFAKLTQSSEFKALWHFAYNNEQYLTDVQQIMAALYEAPIQIATLADRNSSLGQAYQNIANDELGALILTQLKQFVLTHEHPVFEPIQEPALNKAYREFNQALVGYQNTPMIIDLAHRLQSEIFLSSAPDNDKILWLSRTTQFLKEPMLLAPSYFKEAEIAVLSDNPARSRLGKTAVILGGLVFSAILLGGVISSSIVTLPIIIGVGLAALTLMLLGVGTMYSASENKVRDRSQELVHQLAYSPR